MLVPCIIVVLRQLQFASDLCIDEVLFNPDGNCEVVESSLVVVHVPVGLASEAVGVSVRVVFEAGVTEELQGLDKVGFVGLYFVFF